MQRVREELLEVVVNDVGASQQIFHLFHCSVCPQFSSVGARVGGGGPCSRDGAPISTASLNCGGVEFRGSTILPRIFTVDNWMRGQQVWVFGEEGDSDTGEVNKRELVLVFNVL